MDSGLRVKTRKEAHMKTQLSKPARSKARYADEYKQEALELWRKSGRSSYNFCRNNSFKSADEALLARRLNVPFVLMSLAPPRNAPHAARARPEPTEMRRTPRSASWESES